MKFALMQQPSHMYYEIFAIDIGSPYHQLSLGVTPRRLMRKLYISVFTKKTFSDYLTVY